MMAIVKSSIFFLCRWSKSMQQSAARKLQHVMFSPNNLIYQPLGKERIYVVKNGSIDIFAERNGSKRGLNNLLKTITCGLDKEVADNCYGYSSVISDKPNRMYAIARTFTSAYYLTKEMFMESISQNLTDFEYYHELKDKINLNYSCRESIEAPILESHKHHFYPTKASVLKKKFKGSRTNKRRPCDRKERSYRGTKNLYIDIRTRSSTEMEATLS
jgi:signal-transduction protein with cAMP-binding, CBS, and nucleotidyltransferase domain